MMVPLVCLYQTLLTTVIVRWILGYSLQLNDLVYEHSNQPQH